MKQIRFIQSSPMGKVDGLMRVVGKDIFLKIKNTQHLDAILKQLEKKGAKIGKGRNWVRIDIFGDNKLVKLGEYEIDLEKDSEKSVEEKISKFYFEQYKKGGCYVEMQDEVTV